MIKGQGTNVPLANTSEGRPEYSRLEPGGSVAAQVVRRNVVETAEGCLRNEISAAECLFQFVSQQPNSAVYLVFTSFRLALHFEQFITEIQGSLQGDSLQRHESAAFANFFHALVQNPGCFDQILALIGAAGELVFPVQYGDGNRFSLGAHDRVFGSQLIRQSSGLLESFETVDHGFDLAARFLIFGHQAGTFRYQ